LVGIPGDKIDQTHPVYYMHGNHDDARRVAITLDTISDKWTIVCLPENRIAKFERENKHVPNVHKALQAMAEKELAALSEAERLALSMEEHGDRRDFASFAAHAAKINDPAITKAIATSRVNIDKAWKLYQRFSRVASITLPEWTNPLERYPLIDSYAMRSDPEHVIRYINAEYAYQKEQA
jgi:hypothetical protein